MILFWSHATFLNVLCFLGVSALLMVKADELLVGSRDGSVCLVQDTTTNPTKFRKPVHDGIPKTITEPTKPCLTQVHRFQNFYCF